MKKFYTLLIALFFVGGAMGQTDGLCETCLPEGITFETQAQIDSFQINYPGCTEIEGSVKFWSSEVSNLDSLYSIQSIMGGLQLSYATQLQDFSGLENLEFIGGYLDVRQSSINNFNGLNNLNEIAGTFTCENNPNLTSFEGLNELQIIRSLTFLVNNKRVKDLSGLENLEYIGERFIINDNDSLFTLSGLNKLVTIDSGLYISSNYQLQSLTGLNNLTTIGGDLRIFNSGIINLSGFENLILVNGDLRISFNDLLTSLEGLENLNADSIDYLGIYNNYSLSSCTEQFICDYIGNEVGEYYIIDNDPGCFQSIFDSCWLSVKEFDVMKEMFISPNPSTSAITIELPTQPSINTTLTISNTNGQQLINQPMTKPQTRIDISHLPAGIYIVKVWNDREVMVRKVIKQ